MQKINQFLQRQQEKLMGWSGIPSADIFFDNVEVPMGNIIVEANGGFQKLMEAFDLERCGNTTMSLACGQSALDYVLDYVQQREQFEGWRVRQTAKMLSTVYDDEAIREVLKSSIPPTVVEWLIENDALFRLSTFETGVHAG